MTETTYRRTINFEGFKFDPNNELNLNEEQREEMESDWKNRIVTAFDDVLNTYGAVILGNGQIIIDVNRYSEFDEVSEEIFDEIKTTDFDENHEFFEKWATVADQNQSIPE